MPVIGYLSGLPPTATPPYLAAFRQGLDAGEYVEGHTVAIEYRWAEGHYALLPAPRGRSGPQVAVIAATGGIASPIAKWDFTRAGFSRARSQRTCRLCSQ